MKAVSFLLALLAVACNERASFHDYASCVKEKTTEYIDAGASGYDGGSRAKAFCETTYSLLQPSYQPVPNVTVRLQHETCLDLDPFDKTTCHEYHFYLSQPVDLVTLSVTNQKGQKGSFTKVRPTDGVFIWQERAEGASIASVDVSEAWVDINKGKRQGD